MHKLIENLEAFLTDNVKARFEGDFPVVGPNEFNIIWMLEQTKLLGVLQLLDSFLGT
jgi:hypothetical protein